MEKLLTKLRHDFPSLSFVSGDVFSWSPRNQTVTYKMDSPAKVANWSLLHEVAHALLEHRRYKTDFELLLIEVAAWDRATQLATNYGLKVDNEHIQDCIDTYRDWLHQRSACPSCNNTSLQQNAVTYSCFSCGTSWTVTASRFCRPYRLTKKQQDIPSTGQKNFQPTFL